ncbi:NUDIX domain-containing protein [Ruegeria faecimaris]|uniref:ADP-ribose pyrophosphatase n=1 Tax=Ruegeria faecimaris TaxID=686389 RepID=A0A521BF31_9RHOB|nr:NUDIX domain-containing protein [Ruegeria faecimaris]SMO45694.1 nudix-type nucleoside diphosphatase, YffH/AdpP family [Ruegeria faecimaris]
MNDLFFYGTLRHLPLLQLVLGRPLSRLTLSEAKLKDHAVYSVRGEAFPMIQPERGGVADGLLVQGLEPEDFRRLIFYEGGFDYDLQLQPVELPDGSVVEVCVFFPEPDLWSPGELWSLQDWADAWADLTLTAAQEVMGYYGKADAVKIARSFPSIRTRAWAKLGARKRGTGDARDPKKDVIVHEHTHAYIDYFGMQEVQLQHRRNDGTMGSVLNRNGLMQGSAVVVLPYDPGRDAVLLVEQFRTPVFLIEDPEPWMWEPVAGMIDPGETPQQAARREAMEEAQISLKSLEFAGEAYSSSGSSTEYVYLYVGLADLEKTIDDGGLASEGEDIRTKIIPYAQFMDQVDGHGFKDLPLLSLAHWLARNRDRLRGA